MAKEIWFEVFTSDEEEGTRTIDTFDTLPQAKEFLYKYLETHPNAPLHIDKWQDEDGQVTILGEVE